MRDDFTEAHEVGFLFLPHEIPFVRERPPDIPERRQPRDDVMQVSIVRRRGHAVEAPMAFVVRMEQNDVSLNAELLKVSDALFEMLKKFWVEPREVPGVRRIAFEGIEWRLIGVPLVAFGKNAHADFVERRGSESF